MGADPAVLGRALRLNGRDYSVIGVLPASFELLPASTVLPDCADVWLTLEPHLVSRDRSVRFLHVVTRLRPNVTFDRADDELRLYGAQLSRELPAAYPGGTWEFRIFPFKDDVLKNARVALYLLFGLVVLVLLMACSNVANLLLARGEARRTELAIRTALGAGPARLAGELLAESFLLAVCGSCARSRFCGVAAGSPSRDRSRRPSEARRRRRGSSRRDLRAGVGSVHHRGVRLRAADRADADPQRLAVDGGAEREPDAAKRRPRQNPRDRSDGVGDHDPGPTLFLTETFVHLQRVDLGFSPGNVLTGRVSLSPKYPLGPAAVQFFESATAAIQSVPGVAGAAAVTQLPLSGSMLGSSFLVTPDPNRAGSTRTFAASRRTTFASSACRCAPAGSSPAATRPAARASSSSTRRSRAGSALTARCSESACDGSGSRRPSSRSSASSASVRHRGPEQAVRETVYRPHRQYPRSSMFVVVRTNQDAAASAARCVTHWPVSIRRSRSRMSSRWNSGLNGP